MSLRCILAAVLVAGCYSPQANPGAPCGPNGECPADLVCRAGRCGGADLPPDGPGTGDAPITDGSTDAVAPYVPWAAAKELVSLELPGTNESDPTFTTDRLTAFATSGTDIYGCTRTSAMTDTFTCAVIAALDSTATDKSPEISPDGTTLYFTSSRSGAYDIYTSTKSGSVWAAPTIVAQLTTAEADDDVAISPDGLTAVVRRTGPSRFEFHTRTSTAQPFSTPGERHAELEVTTDIAAPSITNGGAIIYFHAGASRDIYMARRGTSGTYGTPTLVTELNTAGRDASPFVSADDTYMMFDRDGDIFETSR